MQSQYRDAHSASVDELIVVDEVPVGRCWTDLAPDSLRLLDLLVSSEFRGRGIASAVMRELKSRATAAGVPILLTVWADNEPARRLYDAMGFVPATERTAAGYMALRWDGGCDE